MAFHHCSLQSARLPCLEILVRQSFAICNECARWPSAEHKCLTEHDLIGSGVQLNDEFAKENIPQSTGIEDARQKLLEAQHLATAEATNNRVVEALGKAVSEAVELDVPQFLLRSTGEQECVPPLLAPFHLAISALLPCEIILHMGTRVGVLSAHTPDLKPRLSMIGVEACAPHVYNPSLQIAAGHSGQYVDQIGCEQAQVHTIWHAGTRTDGRIRGRADTRLTC